MASIKQSNSSPEDTPAYIYKVTFIDRKNHVAFIMNAYFPCEESNFWVSVPR